MDGAHQAYYEIERDNCKNPFVLLEARDVPAHFHRQIELTFVARGGARVTVNGIEKNLSAGEIAVADCYDAHSVRVNDPNSLVHAVIIDKEYLNDYVKRVKNSTLAENFIVKETAGRETLAALLKLFIDGYGENDELFNRGVLTAVMGVIARVLPYRDANSGGGGNTASAPLIRDILAYINANSDDEITLAVLAKRFNYTPNHFSRVFNASGAPNLREYLNAVRTERALSRMNSGMSHVHAALESGFRSMETFYRAFKRRYGQTPCKYVKNQ